MPVLDVFQYNVFNERIVSGFRQVAMNRFFFQMTELTGPDPSNLQINSAITSVYKPQYLAINVITTIFRGTTVQRVWPLPKNATNFAEDAAVGTRLAGQPMPGQICGVITKRTPFAGRKFRGRTYVPFPFEDDGSDIVGPDDPYIALIQNLANIMDDPITLIVGATAATFVPCLFHKNNTPPPTFLQNCLARKRWGTQRSRGGYGGPDVLPFLQ